MEGMRALIRPCEEGRHFDEMVIYLAVSEIITECLISLEGFADVLSMGGFI